jgi:short subunit dehydrogenase-like uncharacterized protein
MARPFDILVLGATGFTGRQVAQYLYTHAPDGVTWALAARRTAALAVVAHSVGDPPTLVLDVLDGPAVDAAVKQARVVMTTVGPYAKYGHEVMRACAEHGTDYVDITGETPWAREMLDAHQETAVASGARIVPFCGFDSVPSDLGAMLVARACQAVHGEPCAWVKGAFSTNGGLNGGTLDTVLHMGAEDGTRDLMDPFLLNPVSHRDVADKQRHYDPRRSQYDDDLGCWTAPFMMGAINTRIVRRSAALMDMDGQPYGPDFLYQEYQRASGRLKAKALTLGMGAMFGLAQRRLGRKILKTFGPKPGEGPSEKSMDNGWFTLKLVGATASGKRVTGVVSGQGDPGNRTTVRCLCEAGLLLATRRDELPDHAGFLTPATAFGDALVEALRSAGMTLDAGVEVL